MLAFVAVVLGAVIGAAFGLVLLFALLELLKFSRALRTFGPGGIRLGALVTVVPAIFGAWFVGVPWGIGVSQALGGPYWELAGGAMGVAAVFFASTFVGGLLGGCIAVVWAVAFARHHEA